MKPYVRIVTVADRIRSFEQAVACDEEAMAKLSSPDGKGVVPIDFSNPDVCMYYRHRDWMLKEIEKLQKIL